MTLLGAVDSVLCFSMMAELREGGIPTDRPPQTQSSLNSRMEMSLPENIMPGEAEGLTAIAGLWP